MKFINKKKLINFFFPMYPIKFKKSTLMIVVLSLLISLRLVMALIPNIPIPMFGMTISIDHTPLIIIGWIFGPVIGFFSGIICDTLSYLAQPTAPWFWLYAIQEPLLVMLVGIISSIYVLRKNSTKHWIDHVFTRLISYSFMIISLIILISFVSSNSHFEGKSKVEDAFFSIGKYVSIACVLFFTLFYEAFNIFSYVKNKKREKIMIYIALTIYLNAILFSFVLGTISAAKYYEFLHNNSPSPLFVKYGYMFYLIPRVIKESIKTPLQILLSCSLLYMILPLLKKKLQYCTLTWDYVDTTNIKIKKAYWI